MDVDSSRDWLAETLDHLRDVRVAVFGDFAVDAYWFLEGDTDELSLETGEPVARVLRQSYALGGAGNVAANLASLGVRSVEAIGAVGHDPFGRELLELLRGRGIAVGGVTSHESWQTVVFAKPHVEGLEQSRIDFGGLNRIGPDLADVVVERLAQAAERCEVVVLNQQVRSGLSSPEMIERINSVVEAHPRCLFLADSRDRADRYRGVVHKINLQEARRLVGDERDPPRSIVQRLAERFGERVFVTRGSEGLLVAGGEGSAPIEVPAVAIEGEVDPVGAGDTVTAAIAAVLGARGDDTTAARLAALAAAVTVRKLKQTGTATPEEILEAAAW